EIVTWLVAPGDEVQVNQPLVEVESAKSLVELPSPTAGVVTALLAEPGDTVAVGTAIVEIVTADEPTSEPSTSPDSTSPDQPDDLASGPVLVGYGTAPPPGTSAPPPGTSALPPGTAAPPAAVAPAPAVHALAKPPVRKLAKDLAVDLDAVAATGPGGIVTREDLLAHVARTCGRGDLSDQPWLADGVVSPDGRLTRVPVRSVRRRTAEAMVAIAFTAPHVTVFHTVDVTATMRLVARLRTDPEFADTRVTPMLIAAKALLLAVKRHPQINARWDDAAREIVYQHYVNLGIAASTQRGLIVPNVKDAHRLGLHDRAAALADLTAKARAGRTTATDTADGTITLTNVGVFGIDTGTPILNPGEAAILAFGAVTRRPWVHKDKVRPRHVTQLALSFDHRLVDGELGSRVLADVAAVLADPAQGLVWG
ncbi:MAG: 2-oxo acid dehydrogenase subunit E2, partial [Cellulomonas sp.]|nr:2-oxo acid dehydrogenase subunit E2 [Cellulomonas sp.]